MKKLLIIILFLAPAFSQAQIITTIAGTGANSWSGDGGPATAAGVSQPMDVAIDHFGNVYFTETALVRKIDTAGIITTVAGGTDTSTAYNGGPATAAYLRQPSAIVFDDSGNYYIADRWLGSVFKINTAGKIYRIAGVIGSGANGDGGPAINAKLYAPFGLALDKHGNIFIGDANAKVVRKVDAAGIITTVAGTGYGGPTGTGDFSGDGGPATAADLYGPTSIAVDSAGNLFIGDLVNNRIRMVNSAGIINTVIGGGSMDICSGCYDLSVGLARPAALQFDASGSLYFALPSYICRASTLDTVYIVGGSNEAGFGGDNGPVSAAIFQYPQGIAFDAAGNMYIADMDNNRIRKVSGHPLGVATVLSKQDRVDVFPNPASNSVIISARSKIGNIAITNLLGQTIYTHYYNEDKVQVNIADLSPGIYLIRINNTEVRKFVKQ